MTRRRPNTNGAFNDAGRFFFDGRGFTHRQVGEDTEGALQEGHQVQQVVAGRRRRPAGHARHPVVIGQLQELVDFGVEAGVDLRLGRVASVLRERTSRDRNTRETPLSASARALTLNVDVPYSLVALAVSEGTLVMFDINSSRKWQLCSRWVVLMITCTNWGASG